MHHGWNRVRETLLGRRLQGLDNVHSIFSFVRQKRKNASIHVCIVRLRERSGIAPVPSIMDSWSACNSLFCQVPFSFLQSCYFYRQVWSRRARVRRSRAGLAPARERGRRGSVLASTGSRPKYASAVPTARAGGGFAAGVCECAGASASAHVVL